MLRENFAFKFLLLFWGWGPLFFESPARATANHHELNQRDRWRKSVGIGMAVMRAREFNGYIEKEKEKIHASILLVYFE